MYNTNEIAEMIADDLMDELANVLTDSEHFQAIRGALFDAAMAGLTTH